ncbi:hypothetical protein R1479_04599 [Ralstonia mannitolilytica]|uniref:hypothetical protein n=1 Tax=Ralstonia mannitolilytica TaxID=105219 RepID=UPI0028F4D531|nr:hypothetical protein [Ralstonia mannitolilytica]CAJ0901215.1 hypothetical protein R1479_04599 [Ralstonia mannitolilytica]
MSAAPKTSEITIHVRRVFQDGSEATFDTTASTLIDAVTAAQHLAGTVTLSAADLPKVTPPAATKTTKAEPSPAPTPAPAGLAADAAPEGESKTETKTEPELDYEKDIKPKVLKLAADKGRDATAATMARFGVKKAPELNKSQWPEFVRFIDRVLAGEIDPMASIPREEESYA